MSTHSRSYPNLYKDSVSLMTVSAKVMAVPGIEAASVVMASATNVENLALARLGEFEVRPNDLVVAVSGTEEACTEALKMADELLSAKAPSGPEVQLESSRSELVRRAPVRSRHEAHQWHWGQAH